MVPTDTVYDMLFLIPTLPRFEKTVDRRPVDYLLRVLREFKKQLGQVGDRKVLFLIQTFSNTSSEHHSVFFKAQEEFSDVAEFVFMIPPFRFHDPFENLPGVDYADPWNVYPGHLARQQSCDMMLLTRFALETFRFKYLMYGEDDFVPCPNFMKRLFDALQRVERHHSEKPAPGENGFCSMKVTTGFGGFVLTEHTTRLFMEMMNRNIDFKPVDTVINYATVLYIAEKQPKYRTCIGEGLTSYIWQQSGLEHIGHVSNWEERNDKKKFGSRAVSCHSSLDKAEWQIGNSYIMKDEDRKCDRSRHDMYPCV